MRLVVFVMLLASATSSALGGEGSYKVYIDTSDISGLPAMLRFEMTSSDTSVGAGNDSVFIGSYTHDASPWPYANIPQGFDTFGGGYYFWRRDPDWKVFDMSVTSVSFLNGITFEFDSLGTFISFEIRPFDKINNAIHPSQFSVYLLDLQEIEPEECPRACGPLIRTDDPLGTNGLFSIVLGKPVTAPQVFYPMRFVPPDSIVLRGSVLPGR
jgi:hypothetical protein